MSIWLTNKAYSSDITVVTNISQSFTYKMAAKITLYARNGDHIVTIDSVTSIHPVCSRSVTDAMSHRATMSSCSRHFTSVHVLWTSVEIYVARVLILIRFSHDRSPTYSIERRFWLHAVQGPRRVFCRKLESRSIFNLSCRKWDALHVAAKETRPHTHTHTHTHIYSQLSAIFVEQVSFLRGCTGGSGSFDKRTA